MKITSLAAGILAVAGGMAAPVSSDAASLEIVFASHGYRPSAYRAGYERGHNEGIREGTHDGRRHEAFSYWDEKRYVRCGYRSSYGPRHEYESGYRRGFEAGYRQSYYASYRCDRHGRVACGYRSCQPRHGSGYAYADDDWASRDDRAYGNDEYRYREER